MVLAALAFSLVASNPVTEPTLHHEVSLSPVAQINTKNTEHYGTELGWSWRFSKHFAARTSVFWNFASRRSAAVDELELKMYELTIPSYRRLTFGGYFGFEVRPISGALAGHPFDMSLDFGPGVVRRAIAVSGHDDFQPRGEETIRLYDAGFGASLNGGTSMRFWLSDRLILRADLHFTQMLTQIDSVQGCSFSDAFGGRPEYEARPQSTCNPTGIRESDYYTLRYLLQQEFRDAGCWMESLVTGSVGLALTL
jgi:hypothetical protein